MWKDHHIVCQTLYKCWQPELCEQRLFHHFKQRHLVDYCAARVLFIWAVFFNFKNQFPKCFLSLSSFISCFLIFFIFHKLKLAIMQIVVSVHIYSSPLHLIFLLLSFPIMLLVAKKKRKLHGRLGGCCPLLSSRCFLSSEGLHLFSFGFCFFLLRNYHRTYLQERLLDFCVQHDILQHN